MSRWLLPVLGGLLGLGPGVYLTLGATVIASTGTTYFPFTFGVAVAALVAGSIGGALLGHIIARRRSAWTS